MSNQALLLQGMERVRTRFITLLAERQNHIAHHALAAWDCEVPAQQQVHLQEAGSALHMIAGTAGSLGFNALGTSAQSCEMAILDYFDKIQVQPEPLPHAVIAKIDEFVAMSQSLLDEFG